MNGIFAALEVRVVARVGVGVGVRGEEDFWALGAVSGWPGEWEGGARLEMGEWGLKNLWVVESREGERGDGPWFQSKP